MIRGEYADITAKSAALANTAPNLQLPLAASIVKHNIRKEEERSVRNRFDRLPPTTNKLRTLALTFKSLPSKISSKGVRKVAAILNNRAPLRIGLVYKGLDPTCQRCRLAHEDNVHFLCECENLMSIRLKFLGSPMLSVTSLTDCKATHLLLFINHSGIYGDSSSI